MTYISNPANGVASSVNTTTTALGAGSSFIGAAEINPFPDVMVSCFSSSVGTLYFDFSDNGTDWRTFPTLGFNVAANTHESRTAVKGPRYFRVRFVNSSSPQSVFQLYTYFGVFRQQASPLNQQIMLDSSAILTRQSISWLDAARGLVGGLSTVKRIGRNAAVGTTFVPLSVGGIYQVPQSSSATALRVKSGGNVNDSAAGTGARAIRIEGLDAQFNPVTEAVLTAGASASLATTALFSRVFLAKVDESGTYATALAGSHAGDIVIENASGGTDWATISATDFPKAHTEIAAYTVPAGKTGYVKLRNVSVDTGKEIDLVFFYRRNADQTAAPYSAMEAESVLTGVSGGSIEDFGDMDIPFGPYVGPTDIGFMAKVSSGTASVAAEFDVFILDEV